MPSDPIAIELLSPLERVHADEAVTLQLLIRCARDATCAELRHIGCTKPQLAGLDIDLFERDLKISPGEAYRCAVSARFHAPGIHVEPLFFVQVGRDSESRRVRIPTPPIRVVPSLLKQLQVRAEAICTYDLGTKVDVAIGHIGSTKFEDFRLSVGPADSVRAGASEQRRPSFGPKEKFTFTSVVAMEEMVLTFDASVGGERIGPVSLPLWIPPVRDAATTAPFRFLEPKKLTQADVRIFTLDEASDRVLPKAGVHFVRGGGTKYRVEIEPAHPHVENVRLRGISGSVEVAEMPNDSKTWAFQMVVLANPVLTTPIVLHYDVTTPDGPQQGEINLAIQPQSTKLWLVALTAGGALTLKGVAAVVPAIVNPSDGWDTLGEAVTKVGNLWDLAQFFSIPIIRGGLWMLDKVAWPLQDG